jgi:hypothetical protein
MKKFLLLFVILTSLSCTENQRVKNFGGNGKVILQPNKKLVNITWKNEELWILTKDMKSNDVAEQYYFSEKSSFGLIEGTYNIIETKN